MSGTTWPVSTVDGRRGWQHESENRVSRASFQATSEDRAASQSSAGQAQRAAVAILLSWQQDWRAGRCVKIEADIPPWVAPSAVRTLPVHVVHKDGSELDAPVDATLSGPKSLDPLRIDHAPGQLTYTAGDKKGDTATVDLVSISRRGIGKVSGTIKVEMETSYQARSIPGVRAWKGACIDALDRGPIVLTWEGGDNSGTFTLGPGLRERGLDHDGAAGQGSRLVLQGPGQGPLPRGGPGERS